MSLNSNILKQPRTKLIMIINVKMPTYVDILTVMSMKNTPSKILKHSMYLYINWNVSYKGKHVHEVIL